MKLTVGNDTVASSPGNIEISRNKYLDYKRLNGISRFGYSLLLSLPEKLLFKAFGSRTIVYDFIQKREQFRYGCLNPTVVLDKEEGLIATFTNLTHSGNGITPVIKISKEPLHLIRNTSIENGQRLPTVSLYYGLSEQYPSAWADFLPKIANCFTDDNAACNRLLKRVSENGWSCLEQGLKQIDAPGQTGLYHVQLEKEMVINS